ncbi:MAG: methylmalonyl Co-A mutase-associated GTPase MeaB [Anaerolineales bacterium]
MASILEGDRLALARLLTQVENDTPEGHTTLDDLFRYTGKAHLIGVTGAPGTGKSTLVNQLALYFRNPAANQKKVSLGIVAVDPSSPFTGGAILGDRVRMRDLAGDPGVFIRSMASRGSFGGLASATAGLVQALDAAGFEVILIETVGAGQAEVDIARLAHTTIVVEAPGLGDEIQAIKAGILEIADILVVNKADRPGVENTVRALQAMLQPAYLSIRQNDQAKPGHRQDEQIESTPGGEENVWRPPILQTVATEGTGIEEVGAAVTRHRQYLEQTGDWTLREKARLKSELDMLLQATLVSRWRETVSSQRYQDVLEDINQRIISPHQAVELLLDGGTP